jgi:hypothetical protein
LLLYYVHFLETDIVFCSLLALAEAAAAAFNSLWMTSDEKEDRATRKWSINGMELLQ